MNTAKYLNLARLLWLEGLWSRSPDFIAKSERYFLLDSLVFYLSFFFFFLPFIIFSFYISWCIFGESPLDCPLVDWWWSTSPWLSRYFSWFLFTVMPSILPRLLLFLCFWFYLYPFNYLKSNPKSPSFISLQLVGIIISYFAVLITLPSWRRGRTWPDMKGMHFLLLLFLLL